MYFWADNGASIFCGFVTTDKNWKCLVVNQLRTVNYLDTGGVLN